MDLEDLKAKSGINSEHCCEGCIAEGRHRDRQKGWILPQTCKTFDFSVSKEYRHEEHCSKKEFIRFWLVLRDPEDYCTVKYVLIQWHQSFGAKK